MNNLERKYEFNYDPNVIKMLGENLYSTIHAALSELVANAFDAAAEKVWITISDTQITVEDNGIGMDYETMINSFLNIAYESRTVHGDTVKRNNLYYKRMGRKGVGKLAALSLGKDCFVFSKTQNDLAGCHISLTDEKIISPLSEQDMIFDKISGNSTGTMIVIKNLRKKALNQMHQTIIELQKRFLFDESDNFSVFIRKEKEEFSDPITWKVNYFQYLDIVYFLDKSSMEKSNVSVVGIPSYYSEAIIKPELNVMQLFSKIFAIGSQEYPESLVQLGIESIRFENANENGFDLIYKHESGDDCTLSFTGWIGTYRTLKKDKYAKEYSQENLTSPDNSLYLYSRKKLGLSNLLAAISTKQVFETYIVGRINIDGFEDTHLPDIATSNRQSYNEEDSRTIIVEWLISILRNKLVDQKKNSDLDPAKGSVEEVAPTTDGGKLLKQYYEKALLNYEGEERTKKSQEYGAVLFEKERTFIFEKKYGEDIIFISHSRKNFPSYQVLYECILATIVGVQASQVFCTSVKHPQYYTNLFDLIAEKLLKSVSIVHMFSEEFQQSMYAQQEVGAGWILGFQAGKKKEVLMFSEGVYNFVETWSKIDQKMVPMPRCIHPYPSEKLYPSISSKYKPEENAEAIEGVIDEICKSTGMKKKSESHDIIMLIIQKYNNFVI